jgi:hypothetical protein
MVERDSPVARDEQVPVGPVVVRYKRVEDDHSGERLGLAEVVPLRPIQFGERRGGDEVTGEPMPVAGPEPGEGPSGSSTM